VQAWRSGGSLSSALTVTPVEEAAREAGVEVVDTDRMRAIVATGSHLILDARPLSDYDAGHLPGAMSLPRESFETAYPELAPVLTPADPLVVYCSGPLCDDALLVIERLREAGFSGASLYLDGWEGWRRE